MAQVKTAELEGAALDWAVAKCLGKTPSLFILEKTGTLAPEHSYSTDWLQGGPIIEREKIGLQLDEDHIYWWAKHPAKRPKKSAWTNGATPLIAAMRCYVASKLGDEVEIPEELL